MGSENFGDDQPVDSGSLEMLIWELFSSALAWTLFKLPAESSLVLSVRGKLSAQFVRASEALYCEVVVDGTDRAAIAAHERMTAQGWDALDSGLPCNRRRILPWPARYSDYEQVAALVVTVLRDIQELWLPMELAAETWTDGTDSETDLKVLGLPNISLDDRNALSSSMLRDTAQLNLWFLELEKGVAERRNQIRTRLGREYLKGRGAEILTGGDAAWPARDRTVDFISMLGANHLLVVDVILDVDDLSTGLDFRRIDGASVQRGTGRFVRGMVRVDPDLPAALANRPELSAAMDGGEVLIEYRLIVMDTAKHIRIVDRLAEDWRRLHPGAATVDPNVYARQALSRSGAEVDRLDDVYPLLKPASWSGKAHAPHRTLGPDGQHILVTFAHNLSNTYEVITNNYPEANDDRLRDRAMANLAALHYEWKFTELQWLRVASYSGYAFGSEKILDPVAMRQAHRLLGAEEIIVSVPRRTGLYAFPFSTLDSMEPTQQMLRLVSRTYADDSYGHAPITPLLFVLRDGLPVRMVNPEHQAASRRRYRAR